MAFGRIMELTIPDSELRVRLAPLRREEMPEFVTNGGMQLHSIIRYLNSRQAPVIEDEYAWYDRERESENSVVWGIYLRLGESWELVGTTGLHHIGESPMKRAISGFLIFRPEWHGKRIATYTHRARTMYAFEQLGLVVIRSSYLSGNTASGRAQRRIGYVHVGLERNHSMVDGKWQHLHNMECVNPAPWAWNLWWGDAQLRKRHQNARACTQEALEWAHQNVVLL